MKRNNKKICEISVLCLAALMLCAQGWAKEQHIVFVQFGHSTAITSVAFSPDGRYALSGSWDNTLKLWDISNGREIRTFKGHSDDVQAVTFSPDGKYALSGSNDKTVRLWDISCGRNIKTFKGHSRDVKSVAFSPDGKHALSGSYDHTLKLWDISSGQVIRTFKGHSGWVASVAFSPDGKYALSGSEDESVRLWDISSGREVRTFKGHPFWVDSVAFSPDGKYALSGSGGSDNFLVLWDISTGRKISSPKGKHTSINSVAFSPDGKYALAGTTTNNLMLWEINTERIRVFRGHSKRVDSVAFSQDGKHALSGSIFDRFVLWDISTGRKIRSFDSGASSLAFSPDGRYALIGKFSGSDNLLLWDISSGRRIRTIKGHSAGVKSVAFSPDGKYALSGSYDHTFKLWDISSGQVTRTFKGHSAGVESVAFSPDGKFALSGSADGILKLWEISTGHEIKTFVGHSSGVESVAFSPDGKYALSGSYDNTLKLWDISSGQVTRTFKGHSADVNSVAFSPDGKYALSGSNDKTLRLWEISTGHEIRTFKGHSGWVASVAFSPDGKYALSGSYDHTIRLWDIATGNEIAQMVSFTNGEWILITPEGFYNCSPNGDKHLNVRIGNNVYGVDQFYGVFYRPDLVHAKLQGDPESLVCQAAARVDINKILTGGAPPSVAFVSPQLSQILLKRDVELIVELTDQGGGIGELEWKINGITIGISDEEERGIAVKTKKGSGSTIRLSKLVTLSPGENNIQVVAYNARNEIASNPGTLRLNLKDEISRTPSLYLVTIGINRYRDKSLWLNYSVPDAKSIIVALNECSKSIFEKVTVTEIFEEQATLPGINAVFKNMATQVETHDVLVLYLAGHGITQDGRYHFLPYDFRYRNEDSIRKSAINQNHLQKWLANIKARKTLVLMDTCNSGSFTKAQVVHRGIAEKTAINKLTRATGRATIVASKDDQPAIEGYKGHGIFTYVLLKALNEADKQHGNRDRLTSISEIAAYVDEQVPNISFKAFGYEQIPQVNMSGRDFPIAVVP